jgi:hypothetical protein
VEAGGDREPATGDGQADDRLSVVQPDGRAERHLGDEGDGAEGEAGEWMRRRVTWARGVKSSEDDRELYVLRDSDRTVFRVPWRDR